MSPPSRWSTLTAGILCLTTALTAQSGTYSKMQEYPIPTGSAFPSGITAGPDGAMWFSETGSYLAGTNNIGRITTGGIITTYALEPLSSPGAITAGPDGALWFTEAGINSIGRITTSGIVTSYLIPTPNSGPSGITAGPDGALWFTEYSANQIGRITTAGAFTEYPAMVPQNAGGGPQGITAGPEGALWFTWSNYGSGGDAQITTAGAVTTYQVPASYGPFGSMGSIVSGTDGALWFADDAGNIWRMTTAGAFTQYPVPLHPSGGGTGTLTLAPDGAMWFAVSCSPCANDWIGRLTTSGLFTEFPVPSDGSLGGIAPGPDGNLWFTDTGFALRIYDAVWSAPICALGLTASDSGTTLATNFNLGIDQPATWSVTLEHDITMQVNIPPVEPLRSFTLDWRLPASSAVLVKAQLSNGSGQPLCAEWTTVNTAR